MSQAQAISKALYQISEGDRKTFRVKFELAHFVATQQLATLLLAIHGVDVATVIRMLASHSITSCKKISWNIYESNLR